MPRKIIAIMLIIGQVLMPTSVHAGLLENIISNTVSEIVSGAIKTAGTNTSGGLDLISNRSDGMMVFSDGDPLVFDPTDEASSKRVTERYLEMKNRIKNKSVLDMQDLVHFGNAIRPYINYLEHVERIRNGEPLTLPPGSSVQIQTGAFCIDPGVPAPAHDAELMLIENDKLLPKNAKAIYDGLMRYSLKNPSERQNIQLLLHDLRNLQTAPAFLVGGIGESKKAYMDKVMPNGGKLLEEYAKANIEKARNGKPRELQSIQDSQKNWQPTSYIAPNIVATAKDVGGNAEGTMMTVTNNSDRPFTFNPANYSAVPGSQGKQRIGISGATNIMGSNGRPLVNEKHVELVETLVDDAKEILGNKTVAFGTTAVAGITVKNPVVQKMLKAAPLAGTMIAAWELYTGRDFFNGTQLSAAEKVLAAMSIVPASGTVTRILGESTRVVVRAAAAAGRNAKTYGGVLSKETVEYYGNEIYNQTFSVDQSHELARNALVAYRDDPSTPSNVRKEIPANI